MSTATSGRMGAALIPGMGSIDDMPVFADEATPARSARRLKLWPTRGLSLETDRSHHRDRLDVTNPYQVWSVRGWRDVVFRALDDNHRLRSDVECDYEVRPPTSDERRHRYVHTYDRGGSYVAGIAGLELPSATQCTTRRRTLRRQDTRLLVTPPSPSKPTGNSLRAQPQGHSSTALNGCAHRGWNGPSRWDISRNPEAWIWPQHGRDTAGWYEAAVPRRRHQLGHRRP